jgi:hypothetical protein
MKTLRKNIGEYFRRRIAKRTAANIALGAFSFILLFHLAVLLGFVPLDMVWGGRLENAEQMRLFESVAIAVNLFMATLVVWSVGYRPSPLPPKVLRGLLWAMAALFALNTVGNLFALNSLESILFTPVTAALSVLMARLAMKE